MFGDQLRGEPLKGAELAVPDGFDECRNGWAANTLVIEHGKLCVGTRRYHTEGTVVGCNVGCCLCWCVGGVACRVSCVVGGGVGGCLVF